MIIKKWGIKKKEVVRFVCEYCECEFFAERGEYKYEFCQREDEYWYTVVCPCCKKTIRVGSLDIETITEETEKSLSHYY